MLFWCWNANLIQTGGTMVEYSIIIQFELIHNTNITGFGESFNCSESWIGLQNHRVCLILISLYFFFVGGGSHITFKLYETNVLGFHIGHLKENNYGRYVRLKTTNMQTCVDLFFFSWHNSICFFKFISFLWHILSNCLKYIFFTNSKVADFSSHLLCSAVLLLYLLASCPTALFV